MDSEAGGFIMDAQDTRQSQKTRQQRKADREKRREERRLERQESAERTPGTGTEVLRVVEGFSEHVINLIEDIMDVVQERRDKNRRQGRVAPKEEAPPGMTA